MEDYSYILDEFNTEEFFEYLQNSVIDGDYLNYDSDVEYAEDTLFNYISETYSVDRRSEDQIWDMIQNEEILDLEDLTRYTTLLIENN
jgi:hypothetical protein|nr:MAG TPA: hypothetical protein [Caudoviricetes sp.]